MEYELLIREAEVEDAAELVSFLNRVSVETDFTSLADQRKRVRHIGDLFIVIGQKYWNNGLGSLLLEEVVEWAQASGILRRLQLTVQTRNQTAVHLYQKNGFVIEGRQERGAYIEEGKFIDVYLMGRLID